MTFWFLAYLSGIETPINAAGGFKKAGFLAYLSGIETRTALFGPA